MTGVCSVVNALAHLDVDYEVWDCGSMLWNPPWPDHLKIWWPVHSPDEPP